MRDIKKWRFDLGVAAVTAFVLFAVFWLVTSTPRQPSNWANIINRLAVPLGAYS